MSSVSGGAGPSAPQIPTQLGTSLQVREGRRMNISPGLWTTLLQGMECDVQGHMSGTQLRGRAKSVHET